MGLISLRRQQEKMNDVEAVHQQWTRFSYLSEGFCSEAARNYRGMDSLTQGMV